jgi:Domain of unknown function (DUF1906)
MICGTFTIRGVDATDLADKMAEFRATIPAPLSVVSSAEADGTFTIVATFTPCDANVSHSPAPGPTQPAAVPPATTPAAPGAPAPVQHPPAALAPGAGPSPAGTLSGVVGQARAGAQGFDCDTPLTGPQIAGLKAAGFAFCLRYISLGSNASRGDLTRAEADRILAGGLALMPVQHVNEAAQHDGWTPSEDQGSTYGQNAVTHLRNVGFPPGVNVWLDLEGITKGTPSSVVIDYCNAWIGQVANAGFVPGLYVGANAILSGDELYYNVKLTHYWKSGSDVSDITYRGYQMKQRIVKGDSVAGVGIDRDVTFTDAFGGGVIWLARNSAGS